MQNQKNHETIRKAVKYVSEYLLCGQKNERGPEMLHFLGQKELEKFKSKMFTYSTTHF